MCSLQNQVLHEYALLFFNWNSKLSTNIQWKKKNHFVFLIFQKLCQNITKKTYFWHIFGPLKVNYRSFTRLFTLHCFFLTLKTAFLCLVPYIPISIYYFLILRFYFHLLLPSLLTTIYILQFTMYYSISLQPAHNIKEIRNTS